MIFRPELVEKILAGEKTETRRPVKVGETECRYKVDKIYAVQPGRNDAGVAKIKVLAVEREILAQITDEGAKREGFDHRVPFLRYWGGLYGGVDMEQKVWVIRFELVDPPKRRGGASLLALGSGAL